MIFSSNLPHCQDQSLAPILTNKHSPAITPILSISALQTPPLHFLRPWCQQSIARTTLSLTIIPLISSLVSLPWTQSSSMASPVTQRKSHCPQLLSAPHPNFSLCCSLSTRDRPYCRGVVTLLHSWEQSFNNSHCGAWHSHLWDCVDVSISAWAGEQGRRGLLDTRWGRSHSCIRRGQGRSLRTSK